MCVQTSYPTCKYTRTLKGLNKTVFSATITHHSETIQMDCQKCVVYKIKKDKHPRSTACSTIGAKEETAVTTTGILRCKMFARATILTCSNTKTLIWSSVTKNPMMIVLFAVIPDRLPHQKAKAGAQAKRHARTRTKPTATLAIRRRGAAAAGA